MQFEVPWELATSTRAVRTCKGKPVTSTWEWGSFLEDWSESLRTRMSPKEDPRGQLKGALCKGILYRWALEATFGNPWVFSKAKTSFSPLFSGIQVRVCRYCRVTFISHQQIVNTRLQRSLLWKMVKIHLWSYFLIGLVLSALFNYFTFFSQTLMIYVLILSCPF